MLNKKTSNSFLACSTFSKHRKKRGKGRKLLKILGWGPKIIIALKTESDIHFETNYFSLNDTHFETDGVIQRINVWIST